MAYRKNETVSVQIEDIGIDGEGIGHLDGYTFFIKDSIPGDLVQAKVVKPKKNYAYARLEKVLTPSPFRVSPKCPEYRRCGGCQIQGLCYEEQLKLKSNKVRNNLVRIGGFEASFIDSIFRPIIGMDNPWNYRNKAQYPIGEDKDGNPIAGFYAGRTHTIISATECDLGVVENKDILECILQFMRDYRIPAYDESSETGLFRHVLIRKGFKTGELMVCIVINGNTLPEQNILVERLCGTNPNIVSISYSSNTSNTNVIMGNSYKTVFGKEYITDYLGDIEFRISPLSFYQVNPVQTEKLYGKALEYAQLTGKETVWDLYCGIGTISLFLAQKAGKVCGVEVIPQAIENAKNNAARNGFDNATFFVGKAEEVLPDYYENAKDKDFLTPDVIVVDPPRKGCDTACLETMIRMQPNRIVYVSCDSATLARDLKYLCQEGYSLEEVTPVDMFPHTVHVETVCLLSKLHEAKHHVSVKLDMDEMDLTSAESKATYEEIKKYVAEHNGGMKVSSLNIAQVKAKYGIIERDNSNT